jgi:hypothetical protein
MTYLERYKNGEHQQVWNELVFLGGEIRREDRYEDALEVARETMRRVRQNIEMLIERLLQIGYIFGYNHLLRLYLQGGEKEQYNYFEAFSWVRKQPPVLIASGIMEEYRDVFEIDWDELADIGVQQKEVTGVAFGYPNPPDMKKVLDEIERMVGVLPLSVRAWYEEVGGVNFFGYHPDWVKYSENAERYLMSVCDPLMILPLDETVISLLQKQLDSGYIPTFEFAPDRHEKNFTSSGNSFYVFELSEIGIDVSFQFLPYRTNQRKAIRFVDYLRMCMAWAGFPGMSVWRNVPQDHLTFLTQDLLPF